MQSLLSIDYIKSQTRYRGGYVAPSQYRLLTHALLHQGTLASLFAQNYEKDFQPLLISNSFADNDLHYKSLQKGFFQSFSLHRLRGPFISLTHSSLQWLYLPLPQCTHLLQKKIFGISNRSYIMWRMEFPILVGNCIVFKTTNHNRSFINFRLEKDQQL